RYKHESTARLPGVPVRSRSRIPCRSRRCLDRFDGWLRQSLEGVWNPSASARDGHEDRFPDSTGRSSRRSLSLDQSRVSAQGLQTSVHLSCVPADPGTSLLLSFAFPTGTPTAALEGPGEPLILTPRAQPGKHEVLDCNYIVLKQFVVFHRHNPFF